jgi:hypothetical protein
MQNIVDKAYSMKYSSSIQDLWQSITTWYTILSHSQLDDLYIVVLLARSFMIIILPNMVAML